MHKLYEGDFLFPCLGCPFDTSEGCRCNHPWECPQYPGELPWEYGDPDA